jgi:endonuclease/exonuclease/phosphatase family metal-dependent hydrolase
VRALTWNLYHGRSLEPAGRSLLNEFARTLAGWEWDVALLQEVPPWWPEPLAAACAATERHVLTSRNCGLPVRRAIAMRAPDLLKANGGGCNAILARVPLLEHRVHRLTRWPERRWAHAVRLAEGWVVNLHASTHREEWARRDTLRALAWAPRPLLVFGGDLNLRRPALDGLSHVASHHVDHLFATGTGVAEILDRGRLSDHAPVMVTL